MAYSTWLAVRKHTDHVSSSLKDSSNALYLQSNLREALLSHMVEYRRTYLAALIAVMTRGDSTILQHLPQSAPLEEAVLPECLDLLLGDLEDQRGGPEFLSNSLCATSLLLSQWSDSRFLHVLLSFFFVFNI